MGTRAKTATSNDDYLSKLSQIYFTRLNQTLASAFPTIPTLKTPHRATLSDFHQSIQSLHRQHTAPSLGAHFGCRISISDYGIVGLATASTRCLAEAIETQMRFLEIITNANTVSYKLSNTSILATLSIKETSSNFVAHQFMLESELSAQIRFINDLLPWIKRRDMTLHLPYACPTTSQQYQATLGCQVRFQQTGANLTFPTSWLEKPLQTTDKLLGPLLTDRCDQILERMGTMDDWVHQIRTYLLTSGAHMQSLAETAAVLNIPVHTLRLNLYKCGTSYKQIILDVRMHLAKQFLEDTHLTLQQISYQLNYTHPSNFQLAFKKYFNIPPKRWREEKMEQIS